MLPTYGAHVSLHIVTEDDASSGNDTSDGLSDNILSETIATSVIDPGPPTHWIGDGSCDEVLNVEEFDFDGGDCCVETCVSSLHTCRNGMKCADPLVLDRGGCPTEVQSFVGNGLCDNVLNNAVCDYDGGDCCADTADQSGGTFSSSGLGHEEDYYFCIDPLALMMEACHVPDMFKIGDGVCDAAPYNTRACNYDGGDCCERTCFGDECRRHEFDCRNLALVLPRTCDVEDTSFLGDGWCDSGAYNSLDCSFDGGDCCVETCKGVLCGQNGWDCKAQEAAVNTSPARRRANTGDGSGADGEGGGESSSSSSEERYGLIQHIVTEQCAAEFEACFEESACGYFFMLGSAPFASELLRELLKCLDDFDVVNHFQVSLLDEFDEVGECIDARCRVEYLQCQVSRDCSIGVDNHPIREKLDACVASFCHLTAAPTASPTNVPTAHGTDNGGLYIEIDDEKLIPISFKHWTVGSLDVIPLRTEDELEGAVHVTTSCDPASDGVSLDGVVLIVKRALCNVYDVVRAAQAHDAKVVIFAADSEATNLWVPRDRRLLLPVLSVANAVAESIETMVRRGKRMRMRLSMPPYCDTMHSSGVDLSSPYFAPRLGNTCCAHSDTVLAFLMFESDFWNLGVREFPFCPRDGMDEVGIEPQHVFDEEEPVICGSLCKRNGVCEDGGEGSVGHSCGWGGDCQDCGPRSRSVLATVLPAAANRYIYVCIFIDICMCACIQTHRYIYACIVIDIWIFLDVSSLYS
jgi:hypothetical protein